MKHPKCYSNGPKSGLNHFDCIHIYPKASARSIGDFELARGYVGVCEEGKTIYNSNVYPI